MDDTVVLGITPVSNIIIDVFKKYFRETDWFSFRRWNRKRKRGFYYDTAYVKRMCWLIEDFWWIDLSEVTIYLPKIMMPLLIQYKSFFFMISPRISALDKRLKLSFRQKLAEEHGMKIPVL